MPQEKSLAHVGERIAHFRRTRGLTQEQLGEAVGRTAQSISDYENSITVAPMDVLFGISEALDVSPAALVGPSPGLAEDGHIYEAGPPASDRIRAVFDLIRRAVDQAERSLRDGDALTRP